MPTVREFLAELYDTDNLPGQYALELIQDKAPSDRWELTLAEELTPGMASAIFDAVKRRLEQIRGYHETPEGSALVAIEIDEYVAFFGTVATRFGIELTSPIESDF